MLFLWRSLLEFLKQIRLFIKGIFFCSSRKYLILYFIMKCAFKKRLNVILLVFEKWLDFCLTLNHKNLKFIIRNCGWLFENLLKYVSKQFSWTLFWRLVNFQIQNVLEIRCAGYTHTWKASNTFFFWMWQKNRHRSQ